MRKISIMLLASLIIFLSCTNSVRQRAYSEYINDIDFVQHNESAKLKSITSPIIIEIFEMDLDYDRYEEENAKQEYHHLSDFQGYYSAIIEPLADSMNIKRINVGSMDTLLKFNSPEHDSFIVDTRKIKVRQGLILFNAKSKPIFWVGNKSGTLDTFIREFFL